MWIGLYGQHYQSYEWIGPGPEPLQLLALPEPEPESVLPVTAPEPEPGTETESHARRVTARVRSVVTWPGHEETRPGASDESEGIWIDIHCSDPALLSTLRLSPCPWGM